MGSRILRFSAAIAAALAATSVLMSAAAPAAADQNGSITITVSDASTQVPLGLARVILDGPVITSELSSPTGKVVFTDVPSGIYRARVVKNGYDLVTSAMFEVLEGRAVTV